MTDGWDEEGDDSLAKRISNVTLSDNRQEGSQCKVRFMRGRVTGSNAPAALIQKAAHASPSSGESNAAVDALDEVLRAALLDIRERQYVLKFESIIMKFMASKQQRLDFPPLSSYHRLLLHRIAQRFHLQHQAVDTSHAMPYNSRQTDKSKALALFKTTRSAVPALLLLNSIPNDGQSEPRRVVLMKRRTPKASDKTENGSSKDKASSSQTAKEDLKAREKQYAEARARIFGSSSPTSKTESPSNNKSAQTGSGKKASGSKQSGRNEGRKSRRSPGDHSQSKKDSNAGRGGTVYQTFSAGPDNSNGFVSAGRGRGGGRGRGADMGRVTREGIGRGDPAGPRGRCVGGLDRSNIRHLGLGTVGHRPVHNANGSARIDDSQTLRQAYSPDRNVSSPVSHSHDTGMRHPHQRSYHMYRPGSAPGRDVVHHQQRVPRYYHQGHPHSPQHDLQWQQGIRQGPPVNMGTTMHRGYMQPSYMQPQQYPAHPSYDQYYARPRYNYPPRPLPTQQAQVAAMSTTSSQRNYNGNDFPPLR